MGLHWPTIQKEIISDMGVFKNLIAYDVKLGCIKRFLMKLLFLPFNFLFCGENEPN